MTAGWLLTLALLGAVPAPLVVSVGGPPENPAYLPVHAAAALGTFEAEGLRPTLRRAKHPTAAVDDLRTGEAAVAVTTADQAIRGAASRGTPVRILVAHTRAPAAVLLVSARHQGEIAGVESLRGKRVGIPGPGTTGHLLLTALLGPRRIEPWQLDIVSVGGPGLIARLGTGELAAAVVEEPWASRALATPGAAVLLDFRRPEDAARHLGGAFYEVVSVAATADVKSGRLEPALTSFVRAVLRVQAWLAVTPPAEVAGRLPPALVGDRARFVQRLGAARDAYAADGEAKEDGLAATFRVLRGGRPWPAGLKLEPGDVREPAFVSAARAQLGPAPPPP